MPISPKEIFLGKIEGLKISNEAFTNISFTNSLPSLSKPRNSLEFTLDLFRIFFGSQRIKDEFTLFLLSELKSLEKDLISYFKQNIIDYLFCPIDVTIPEEFFTGVTFTVKELDFFEILKIDPESSLGNSYYEDYENNLNKLLYLATQTPGVEHNWNDILLITFSNQSFTVKVHPNFQGKTVYDFVNAYLSKVQFFNDITIISDVLDGVFGVVSSAVSNAISNRGLRNREQFNILMDRILDDVAVDDSFYTFDDEEIERRIKQKKEGYFEFVDCEINFVKYDYNLLQGFVDDLLNVSQYNEEIYNVNFDYLINQTSPTVSPSDKNTYQNNIFLEFFRQISKSIVLKIFSPKQVLFIKLFRKMVKKADVDISFLGFFQEHRKFIFDIVKKHVTGAIIRYLIIIITKELNKFVAENNLKKEQEQLKQYILQITSLIGFVR